MSDPSAIRTPAQLAAALNELRTARGLSYAAIEKEAARLRPSQVLPSSTANDMTRKGRPTRASMETFLKICRLPGDQIPLWMDAWQRAQTAKLGHPAGAVRVVDASPRLLGVHAAIRVPGTADDTPPAYVCRDVDTGELGIRAWLRVAARDGGFLLLVGGSCVGKTRSAFEAVQAELAEWWLVHPVSAHDLVLLAEKRPGHTVVWLDEIQNYLGGDNGLGASTVRALLGTPDPIILVGTIWPQRYAVYTAFPKPNAVDQYFRERDVLKLADAIFISPQLSAAEQQRARGAAIRDQRIRIALDACEHGLTRTLAAAPLLVARWEGAETDEPYAWAVITAALDAARLGATQPLTAKLLSSAAPGYCASRQLADAPTNWFRSALAYATQKVHGAAAALEPEGARMNSVTGYAVADYLLQQSIMTRRTVAVPASLWDALAVHGHSCDLGVIARAAESRGLVRVALNLYEAAAASGDSSISAEAGMMLGIAGRTDDAISWYERGADAGDMSVFVLAGGMLEQVERIDEALVWYRRGAHLNDYQALDELVRLLERTRRQDEAGYWRSRLVGHPVYARLRAGIKNGNEQLRLFFDESRAREESYYSDQGWTPGSWQVLFWKAIMRNDMTEVASALAGQADLQEEYLAYLRRSSDAAGAEECEVSRAYIDLLTIYNRVEIAEAWLRQRIDVTGAGWMILRLARLLGATGRIDEALVWYDHTSIVDGVDAMVEAAELLGKVGRIDEALRRFYRASMSGCREGLWGAVRLLRLAGRVAHADSLQRYGWSAPTGSAARPWQISVHEIARTQATP